MLVEKHCNQQLLGQWFLNATMHPNLLEGLWKQSADPGGLRWGLRMYISLSFFVKIQFYILLHFFHLLVFFLIYFY